MSIGNVQLLQDYLPDVAVQAVEYRNVYRGHASRRTANRPARSAYRRRSVLSKFVLNSWCSVRNARSLVNEVGWMADEKMSEGSAVECLDTQDMVPESRISLRNTFASMRYPNFRIWFAGQLVSLFGTWMQVTAPAYLPYQLTTSPASYARGTSWSWHFCSVSPIPSTRRRATPSWTSWSTTSGTCPTLSRSMVRCSTWRRHLDRQPRVLCTPCWDRPGASPSMACPSSQSSQPSCSCISDRCHYARGVRALWRGSSRGSGTSGDTRTSAHSSSSWASRRCSASHLPRSSRPGQSRCCTALQRPAQPSTACSSLHGASGPCWQR